MNDNDSFGNLSIIHLKSWMKQRRRFRHPILDKVPTLPEEALAGLIEKTLAGDKAAREELINGNLLLVKWLVGRYLYHWPETQRFEEDICSEGITAVVNVVNSLTPEVNPEAFRAGLVLKIKLAIEVYLNDMRSIVAASRATNFRRVKAGEEPEYVYAANVDAPREEKNTTNHHVREPMEWDDTPDYIDLLDSLERLREIDSEEMVDMVLLVLEQQHHLLEEDLTDKERDLIHRLASIGAYCG